MVSQGSIVWTPFPFLKGWAEVNFNYLPQRGWGDSEKLKRGGESMVQGQVFLKGGGGERLVIFPLFQGLFILHSEITLSFEKVCYAFEKILFSATKIL